jgi:hypothetical protein
MKIRKIIAAILLAASLAGCGLFDALSNGVAYSKAVAADLERSTGLKPGVGFNWHNGSLETVTVTFPRLVAGKPLDELAGTVREAVAKEFKTTPNKIVLAFEMEK